MARIEWQPLAIPDIGESAIRAQQAAAGSIRNAFQDFTGVLNQWEGQRREENLTEMYRRQNRFLAGAIGPDGKPTGIPDVAGYQADLADGDLMGDLSYLKAADLAAARGFVGELRTGRQAETTFARGQVLAGREDDAYARQELERTVGQNIARTLLPLRIEMERTGDTRAYDAAMAGILEANPGATAAQIEGIIDGRQEAGRAFRETRNSDQSYRQTQYTFDRTLKTDRQNDRAAVILNELTRDNIDGVSALSELNSRYGNEDAEVLNAIRAQIPNAFATLDAVTAEASGGGSFAGQPSGGVYDTVLGNGAFGNPPKPISEMTIGEAIDFGRNTLIPNTRGNRQLGLRPNEGSSAVGAYQFTQATLADFAPRVLGSNWRNQLMSGQNQERIAEAIFRDTRGQPDRLRGRWQGLVGLSDARLREIGQMPWQQARQEIAKVEAGMRIPEATPAGSVRTSRENLRAGLAVGTDGGFAGNRTAPAVGYLAASQRPAVNAQAIATELTGEGGVFNGVPTHRIRDDVSRLAREMGVSPSIAGWALAETVRNRNGVERGLSFTGITGPVAVDYNAAKRMVQTTRTPEMRENVSLVERNVEVLGRLDAAEAAATAAQQRLATAQARVQANGGRGDISRYVAEAQATNQALLLAQEEARQATIARPVGDRPPAPVRNYQRSYVNTPPPPLRRSTYQGAGSADRR